MALAYIWLAWHCWRLRRETAGTAVQFLYTGRMAISGGIVLLTFASLNGFIERYGTALTIRVPLAALAMILLAAAWMISFRFDLEHTEKLTD